MVGLESLSSKVERRIDLPGMWMELLTLDWTPCESVVTVPTAYYFTQTLRWQHEASPLSWKLPGTGRFVTVGPFGVSPANTRIEVRRRPDVVRSFLLGVQPETFQRVTGLDEGWYNERLMFRVNKEGVSPVRLLNAMAIELSAPGWHSEMLLGALATNFLVQFSRLVRQDRAETQGPALSEWQMNRVRKMIETLPPSEVRVDDLAKACGISARHLMRGFKATMGTTVHGYVDHVRVERAKSRLSSTQTPLEVIAAEVGYSSGSHMATAFARSQGMSPSLFRQRFST
jgi:AraC family transcriptional regulator